MSGLSDMCAYYLKKISLHFEKWPCPIMASCIMPVTVSLFLYFLSDENK